MVSSAAGFGARNARFGLKNRGVRCVSSLNLLMMLGLRMKLGRSNGVFFALFPAYFASFCDGVRFVWEKIAADSLAGMTDRKARATARARTTARATTRGLLWFPTSQKRDVGHPLWFWFQKEQKKRQRQKQEPRAFSARGSVDFLLCAFWSQFCASGSEWG